MINSTYKFIVDWINSIKIIRSEKLITNKDTIIEGEDIYLSVKILPKN